MNEKDIEEFENNLFPPLHVKLKRFFLAYLKFHDQNNEIIESAEKLNYELIIEIYKQEFNKLWNKYDMSNNPNFTKNKEYFYDDVYENILHSICYFLFWSLKKDAFRPINNNIKYFGYVFAKFLSPFYFLLRLNENDKELYKELAERGKKFSGKSFKNSEIVLFESIIQKYNDAINSDDKRSYRYFAHNVYKNITYRKDKDTFKNFYNRFMYYKKIKQKNYPIYAIE